MVLMMKTLMMQTMLMIMVTVTLLMTSFLAALGKGLGRLCDQQWPPAHPPPTAPHSSNGTLRQLYQPSIFGKLLSGDNWFCPSWSILSYTVTSNLCVGLTTEKIGYKKSNANILNVITADGILDGISFWANLWFCPRWWFLAGYWLCVTNKLLSQE